MSTVDDSSATEGSPGSSPESPPPSGFAGSMLRPRTSDEMGSPFFEMQKQPPPRKGRNLKNLAVNTSRHTPRAQSTTSIPLQAPSMEPVASLASPGFVKPRSPPKRKPGNLGLTLLTPGSSKPAPQEIRLAIPPTPSFSRPGTLRHFQSSPSLPLIPGLASQTGVGRSSRRPLALETILSPIVSPKSSELQEEEEQNFDVPLSREEKPEAYPDGPICVYDPYVDLYLEPTAEQCRQYDVVMNVASEVRNPLGERAESDTTAEPDIRIDGGGGIQYAPRRAQLSVRRAVQESEHNEQSPTTPKATPLSGLFPAEAYPSRQKDPEYVHIKWEHNSDIVPDLLRLCKLIDDKVQQKKRVLVHCQCGVSRSASLVVAYGLYKDPTLSVQEAYDAIKARSRWIGPNMNLIMQLQEYRTSLTRGGILSGNRGLTPITPNSAYTEWRGPFSTQPSDPSMDSVPLSAAPAPANQGMQHELPALTPGPSSAPSDVKWPTSETMAPLPVRRTRALSAVKRASAYVDPSGHIVPVLQLVETGTDGMTPGQSHGSSVPMHDESDAATPTESLPSPKLTEFAMTPLRPGKEAHPVNAFGLLSPTSSDFSPSTFDRSAMLASVGMGSMGYADAPRRAVSLRTRSKPTSDERTSQPAGLAPSPEPRLRGKISSPSLREQQQLHSLRSQIQSSLPLRVDEALMSPRAEEFTKNPFALSLSVPKQQTEASQDGGLSTPDSDPRSPAQVGVSPITWNILDVL
ncbi:hypothetical protein BAUCODRAFT_144190 [Baudoinia panamericana UAMH 10762]|uniref:protein-tyrosine-phosphatase n=1 Tax=Baudoinia panamericana (strain UAMH 10762) TaxID=717646 RepID=M2MUE2_BAUPA|nr:uncharacterized protein BAUCODRAFT_144190 [Baudoinia panamericana UAMH 10762]EMD00532.1 hypothetical protein BAUCODRAFT_144190 [Baudoinia panamericana UAMH 10762]